MLRLASCGLAAGTTVAATAWGLQHGAAAGGKWNQRPVILVVSSSPRFRRGHVRRAYPAIRQMILLLPFGVEVVMVRLLLLLLLLLRAVVQGFMIPLQQRRRSTVSARSMNTVMEPRRTNEEELVELHRTVAKHDAEWFQEFIVEFLGEDQVDASVLEILQQQLVGTRQSAKSQPLEETKSVEPSSEVLLPNVVQFVAKEGVEEKTALDNVISVVEPKVNGDAVARWNDSTFTAADSYEEFQKDSSMATLVADETVTNATIPENCEDSQAEDTVATAMGSPDRGGKESPSTTSLLDETHHNNDVNRSIANGISNTEHNHSVAVTNRTTMVYYTVGAEERRMELSRLSSLGYSELEILELEPTALELIATERLPRPRVGVPSRWKRNDTDRVEIREATTVQQKSKESQSIHPVTSLPIHTQNDDDVTPDSIKETMEPTSRESSPRDAALLDNTIGTDTARSEEPRRRRRRRSDVTSEEPRFTEKTQVPSRSRKRRSYDPEKAVFSVREPKNGSRRNRHSVPLNDPPTTGFWPDLPTFRRLLRDETNLRINVLGRDWRDTIEQENDWRLGLYTSWLRTLHNGIGEPFIQSRSDRRRAPSRRRRQRQRT